jgi:hypothetical protein
LPEEWAGDAARRAQVHVPESRIAGPPSCAPAAKAFSLGRRFIERFQVRSGAKDFLKIAGMNKRLSHPVPSHATSAEAAKRRAPSAAILAQFSFRWNSAAQPG